MHKKGSISFWNDNWTGIWDLYTIIEENFKRDDSYEIVKELTMKDEWDAEILEQILSIEVTKCIIHNIKSPKTEGIMDKPC